MRLQVDARLRGPLSGALLARGMQPVVGGKCLSGLALEIRAFGPDAVTEDPRRASAAPPMLALLPVGPPGDEGEWRTRALHAGALSLFTLEQAPSDCDTIARLAVRLIRHGGRDRSAPPAPEAAAAPPPQVQDHHTGAPALELTAALADAVAHAQPRGAIGALVLIGLNRLAEIETALGAHARKAVLDTIETRLNDALRREGDRHRLRPAPELYPYAGGFALVWPQLSHGEHASQTVHTLLDLIAEPLSVADEDICVSAGAGISLLPHDGVEPAALLAAAERALHLARADGSGCRFHAQDIAPRSRERLRLETRLRRAIADGAFELHYQPQVDLQTGVLTGAEALLRWPDADAGAVEPAVFIPLAEASGLIVPLGHWVLQRVCRQIRRWLDRGLHVPRIWINVSALQLRQPDFVTRVMQALADAGLGGRQLGIELTEATLTSDNTMLTHPSATLRQHLQALREAGVQLAIDDFGTGCSSLASLKRLPLDGLKIDGSFVADIGGDGGAICSAIIGLAHALGLRVVAEGIETDAQLAFLREQGCDEFQGHVLAPALEPTTMGEVLAGATIQYRVNAVEPAAAQPTEPASRRAHAGQLQASPPMAIWPAIRHDTAREPSQLY